MNVANVVCTIIFVVLGWIVTAFRPIRKQKGSSMAKIPISETVHPIGWNRLPPQATRVSRVANETILAVLNGEDPLGRPA